MSSEVETLEALLATVQRNRRLPRPARGAFTARPTESPASPVSSAPASARAAARSDAPALGTRPPSEPLVFEGQDAAQRGFTPSSMPAAPLSEPLAFEGQAQAPSQPVAATAPPSEPVAAMAPPSQPVAVEPTPVAAPSSPIARVLGEPAISTEPLTFGELLDLTLSLRPVAHDEPPAA